MLKMFAAFAALCCATVAAAQPSGCGTLFPCTSTLGLALPSQHYPRYDVPTNANWQIVDTFATTTLQQNPTLSQTVTQPAGTYSQFNALFVLGPVPTLRFGPSAGVWVDSITVPANGTLSFDTNTPGNGSATIKFGIANAASGYQINGAAPLNHFLIGNGIQYVDSTTLPAGALNYQTVASNGTAVNQEPVLNFSAQFQVSSTATPARTTVSLGTSGVSAGTYSYPASIGVDGFGRVTSISSSGTATPRTCNSNGCYIIQQDGTIIQWGVAPAYGTGAVSINVTFPHPFTTSANLTVTTSCGNVGSRTNCTATTQNVSVTGVTIGLAGVIYVGGSGSDLSGLEAANWFAIGN